MKYPILIEHGDPHQAIGVTVPDIEGCNSAADSEDQVLELAREAIISHLKLLAEDGIDPPTPKPLSFYKQDPKYKDYVIRTVTVKLEWSLDDVSALISKLNGEYCDAYYRAGGSDSVPYFVTMETDGDVFIIKFLGTHVYDSENCPILSNVTAFDLEWLEGEIRDRAKLFKYTFSKL
jgi:predicted RNase H-like HicB family nuclease